MNIQNNYSGYRPQNQPAQYEPAYYKVQNIGRSTILSNYPQGYIKFNEPLINAVVAEREKAIPYLYQLLATTTCPMVISEGAYVSQRLAEANVNGVERLYPILAMHSGNQNPVVQTMLAGAFRAIGEPSAAGPLSRMLYNNLTQPVQNLNYDPSEEIAGSLIELIAQRAADNMYKQLHPRLNRIESKLNIQA